VVRLAIITRPGATGERLVGQLRSEGRDALWFPAFELGPPPDEGAARAALARVGDFDLAIFVSPAAVRAAARLLQAAWPGRTAIGAVGRATAQAVEQAIRPAQHTAIVVPDDEASGSEAFWAEWKRSGRTAGRVLILRAQTGRDWLADAFAATGAQVEAQAVYTRTETVPDPASLARIAEAVLTGEPAAILFTSSEAVEALEHQLAGVPGASAWLRHGRALASHERIAERLLAAGYTRVELAAQDNEGLRAQL